MYYFTNKFLSQNKVVVTMSGDIGDDFMADIQITTESKIYITSQKLGRFY